MPIWLDGGPNERQEKQRIKLAVKKNFRERKSLQARRLRDHNRTANQGQSLSSIAEQGNQTGNAAQPNAILRNEPSPILTPQSLQSRVLSGQSFAEPLHYDEASLLMHYLDHVFPYQYPFFDKARLSRGWLLWLLSKNGPLYRASMGLAALHQRSLLGKTNNHHLELEFHTKAVRQLQDFLVSIDINELRPENETLVEIITCGIALISFEVLRGSSTDWQPHLSAMSSIAAMMHNQPRLLHSVDQHPTPLFEGKANAAMAFHLPVLLWMDLLACVATREAPKLPYDEWLGPNCTFQLAHIMGCHNSVMKGIGDISLQKKKQLIEDELESVMDTTPMASMGSQGISSMIQSFSHMKSEQRPEQDSVTRIFAAAALSQLASFTAEVSNNISMTVVRRSVSRVILEIKMAPQIVSPRHLSWPICVAGCLADQDQQPFFEALLSTVLSEGTGMIGNCGTVRDILRACWRNKAEQPDQQWDCSSTMKQLDIYALLI
ncbi:related to C6 zink-finger protein PRO1A [Fusarium fujikuroi IMI 58289]|uniref:Related to C6 zink-finger protein PRO1A n=1 Tax=Gibberella fujikuroi (strain CBS 195.34 / IMI 58289 / NRRL A-6831) TaxID=1279085 RepID=S0DS06_GIBF5|nr:related to C6 zink-finger protein PRO1A [Fusarium fujikuroi IMI 58289]CCT65220.1 related to C6 zink-finger protein PRO1A [Fusarium fujikuroi IMI 58289]